LVSDTGSSLAGGARFAEVSDTFCGACAGPALLWVSDTSGARLAEVSDTFCGACAGPALVWVSDTSGARFAEVSDTVCCAAARDRRSWSSYRKTQVSAPGSPRLPAR